MTTGFPQHGISIEQFWAFLPSYLQQVFGGSWRAKLPIGWLEDKINAELQNIQRDIEAKGFGPQTPYFNEVLQYYSQQAGYMDPLIQQYQAFQPEPQIGGYEVETQGGYNFAVVRDQAGNIIDIRSLGQAETATGGLTAYQQQQLGQWQQEFQLQQQQLQMQQQQAMMPYQQMTVAQQAQYGLQQQAYRAETMAMPPSGWIEQWYRMQGMSPPSYNPQPKPPKMTWPEYKKKVEQTQEKATEAIAAHTAGEPLPNINEMPLRGNWVFNEGEAPPGAITPTITEPGIVPYTQSMGGYPQAGQYAGQWIDPNSGTIAPRSEFSRPSEMSYQPVSFPGLLRAENLAPLASKNVAGGFIEPQTGSVLVPLAKEDYPVNYATTYPGRTLYTDMRTGTQVQIVDTKKPSTGGLMKKVAKPTVKRPTTPPAPPGLSRFVPSQVTGQPITRAPTTTPSGQMWGQTPWSQQEMLRGYTQYAGYRPYEDIMQHMYAMQPRTPAGAGRKTWTPARQYA